MRLIDADALRDKLQEEIDKAIPPFDDVIGSIRCGVRLARNIVEDEPTVDAVPVIRCRDCKRWRRSKSDTGAMVCDWDRYERTESDYCSWAKRRTDVE